MLKLVIFDLDDTLLHLPVNWAEVKEEVMEYARRQRMKVDAGLHIIPYSSAVSNTRKRKNAVDAVWRRHELETLKKRGVRRYQKAEQFVKGLKQSGLKLAIASNNCHKTIEKALSLAGILGCFNRIIGRDDVLHTKPAPDALLKLAWKFKLRKDEILFIGDSENDRKAGEAANIKTIIVKPDFDFPRM